MVDGNVSQLRSSPWVWIFLMSRWSNDRRYKDCFIYFCPGLVGLVADPWRCLWRALGDGRATRRPREEAASMRGRLACGLAALRCFALVTFCLTPARSKFPLLA